MSNQRDFHERADELAVEIERSIEDGRRFLDALPGFRERSDRSRRLHEARLNEQ